MLFIRVVFARIPANHTNCSFSYFGRWLFEISRHRIIPAVQKAKQ